MGGRVAVNTWLSQWIKTNSIILVNAISLIGTTAITSVLGFAYWWLAARRFLPEDVGIASAAVSAMLLLGSLCVVGLGTLLITELPRQPGHEVPLISSAVVVVALVGGLVGFLFAAIAPLVSPSFRPLGGNILDILIFAAGVSLTSISLVLDQACIGLLRGGLQFWRNSLFAFGKLAVFLFVNLLASRGGMLIYATWACGNALSFAVFVPSLLAQRKQLHKQPLLQRSFLQKLGLVALQHHFLNILVQAPTLLLPILVTALLSAKMNAWFYVSWMLANFVFMIPLALTTVLHAANSAQPSTLAHKARMTIGLSVLASLVAVIVLLTATKQILGLFDHLYADQAAWCLRILALAAFPQIIKNHYLSICRIQDRILRATLIIVPGCVLELTGAVVGAYTGSLTGLCLGWVVGMTIEALIMSPVVYQAIRPIKAAQAQPAMSRVDIYEGQMAIWLVDTAVMPIIPSSRQKVPR